ncbi:hypothetical protein [Streptomyces sp. NPDC058614]|uniref:hypothetical protein n=1 Tax=Streptomyces sp. NPDC058614 TaxID=3346557 RepID=UPI0036513495
MIARLVIRSFTKERAISAVSRGICQGIPAAVGGSIGGPMGGFVGAAVGSLAQNVVEDTLTEVVDTGIAVVEVVATTYHVVSNAELYARLYATRKVAEVAKGMDEGPGKELFLSGAAVLLE